MNGYFVISLDFEGMWGSIGSQDSSGFSKRTKELPKIVSRMLHLFSKYKIHATWGIVGGLGCSNSREVLNHLKKDVYYERWKLSIKEYVSMLQESNVSYFAPELVKMISNVPNQEIASHTFTHIYLDEKGEDTDLIWQDIIAAQYVLEKYSKRPVTMIFPKNQYDPFINEYLQKASISIIRGNPEPILNIKNALLQKTINFTNCYFKLKRASYDIEEIELNSGIFNVRSSLFFRTWYKNLCIFEPLKFWRIESEMNYAAMNGKVFHLWWHPHNMATRIDYNFKTLEKILYLFDKLNKRYNFQSSNMYEVAQKVFNQK